jgi:methylase of polypeptide subunit release factors
VREVGAQAVVRRDPQVDPRRRPVNDLREDHLAFAGLTIAFDDRVLRPRPWTAEQARWAAELLGDLPPGPVLELCCGVGQLGLAAVVDTDRSLVCVDLDATAAAYAAQNARTAGLEDRVEVRRGRFQEVVRADERFPLVIADPPWVASVETGRVPQDPLLAIDGGADGLTVARACLDTIEEHLGTGGAALLQLGSVEQVAALMSLGSGSLRCLEVRRFDGGAVARLARTDDDEHPA